MIRIFGGNTRCGDVGISNRFYFFDLIVGNDLVESFKTGIKFIYQVTGRDRFTHDGEVFEISEEYGNLLVQFSIRITFLL